MVRAGPHFPGKAGCFSVRVTVKGHYSLHKSKYTGFSDDRRGCILVDAVCPTNPTFDDEWLLGIF